MHHEKVDFDQSSTLSWWKHVVLANSMAKTHSILTHQKNDTVLCFFSTQTVLQTNGSKKVSLCFDSRKHLFTQIHATCRIWSQRMECCTNNFASMKHATFGSMLRSETCTKTISHKKRLAPQLHELNNGTNRNQTANSIPLHLFKIVQR